MLVWRDNIRVTVRSFFDAHIDTIVNDDFFVWRFAGFSRALLCLSSYQSVIIYHGWLAVTLILYVTKNLRSSEGRRGDMVEFQSCLGVCYLYDLSWNGYRYTWSNRQRGIGHIV